ncbi:hypothetical protein PG989_001350 [Apiospora arundinis]
MRSSNSCCSKLTSPPTKMGSRNPRRSACDLCRAYKLKCDRDDRHGKSCDRCIQANQACTITLDPPSRPSNSSREREHRPNATTNAAAAATATTAHAAAVPALRTLYPSVSAEPPPHNIAERVSSGNGNLNHQDPMDYPIMDYAMPIPNFDIGDFSFLSSDTPLGVSKFATTEMPDSRDYEIRDNEVSATASRFSEPWKLSHGGLVSPRHSEPNPPRKYTEEHEFPAADSKKLTQLSLEISEDYELLRNSSPLKGQPENVPHNCTSAEQHRPFNRMFDQASRLWEIIQGMSAFVEGGNGLKDIDFQHCNRVEPSFASPEEKYNAGTSTSTTYRPTGKTDQILILSLITTYAWLMRNCRSIFMRLLMALKSDASAKLILPSLQFGSFQLSNSLPIQVKVLIDITSGMLLRITNALGLSPVGVATGSPPASTQEEPGTSRLPFVTDPIYISFRDSILSQDLNLPENDQNQSLQGIMVDIQRLVDQKFK